MYATQRAFRQNAICLFGCFFFRSFDCCKMIEMNEVMVIP